MSRIITADANTQVITVQSSTGFAPGDYIYVNNGNYVPVSSVAVGSTNTVIAGTAYTGSLATLSTSAFIGPVSVSGTYSGTTISPGAVVAGPLTFTAPGDVMRVAALSNGNFVICRPVGSTIYVGIYSSTGSVVVAETALITDFRATGGSYDVTATGDGYIAISYAGVSSSSYGLFVKKYNLSLTQLWSYQFGSGSVFTGNVNNASVSSGQIATGYYSGGLGKIMTVSSSGSLLSDTYFNGGSNYYTYLPSITAGTNNQFYSVNYDWGSTSSLYGATYTAAGAFSSYNGLSYISSGYSTYPHVIALANGNLAFAGCNSSTLAWTTTNSSLSTIAGGQTSPANMPNTCVYGKTLTTSDSSIFGVFGSSNATSNYPYYTVQATSGGSFVTPVNIAAVNTGQYVSGAAQGPNGIACVVFQNSGPTTGYAYFIGGTNQTVTNGATLTGQISYPTYTFVGVAVSTCSAGGTGQVMVKGTTTVGSGYGSASTLTGFDLTSSGSPVANKGSIIGRTITLNGA
jgi:hypothetical protein